MLRIHGDRDQIDEAGVGTGRLDQGESDALPRRLGDERRHLRAREELPHDRTVVAETGEGRGPEPDDERGVVRAPLADGQPRPIVRTIAHSASVTGCTESRLPRCRRAILASPGTLRIASSVTEVLNFASSAISIAVQASSVGSGKPALVTLQVPMTAFSDWEW